MPSEGHSPRMAFLIYMRKLPLIFVIFAALLGACTTKETSFTGEKNYDSLGPVVSAYLPARIPGDRFWGMVRPDGSMIFRDRFPSRPSASVNGMFSVKNDAGNIDIFLTDTVPVAVKDLRDLKYAGAMAYGMMPVTRKGKRIELVDASGATAMGIPAIDGREIVKTAPYFVDGLLAVYTQDCKWGAINTRGEMVVDAIYDSEPQFSGRIAAVTRHFEERIDSDSIVNRTEYYLVNSAGHVIFTFPKGMKPRSPMRGNRMIVELPAGSFAAMTADGKIEALPSDARRVIDHQADYIIYASANDDVSLITDGMRPAISSMHSIAALDSCRFLTQNSSGTYSITDADGKTSVNFNGFDSITCLSKIAPSIVTPFQLIGYGPDGMMLKNYHGRTMGNSMFSDLTTSPTLLDDGYVYTDFFNAQNSLHAILSRISTAGWDRARLGAPLSELSPSVSDSLTATCSIRLTHEKMYMLDIDVIAYSDKPAAIKESSADSAKVINNPDSHIRYIRVEAAVPRRLFSEMLHNVGSELVPRGFRAEKIREEYAVYTSPDSYIILTPRPGLLGLYLFILDKDMYSSAGERIISDGERIYSQELSRQ